MIQRDARCNTAPIQPIRILADTKPLKPTLVGTSMLRCFNCGEIEHMWNECRKSAGQPKKQLLIKKGYEQSKEEQEPIYDEGAEEEDDFMLFGDSGKALVI